MSALWLTLQMILQLGSACCETFGVVLMANAYISIARKRGIPGLLP